MEPIYFSSPAEFRAWLEENYEKERELLVGFYKVGTGKPSMTWSQAVDQALCFGWIDGVRRSVDKERYINRFTPRRPMSNWSAINIKKVEELTKLGQMKAAGIAAFEKRKDLKSRGYSYKNRPERLSTDLEKVFKAYPSAWTFFSAQAPSYRKSMIYWVMDAKQEVTKMNRLNKLIQASEDGKRLL